MVSRWRSFPSALFAFRYHSTLAVSGAGWDYFVTNDDPSADFQTEFSHCVHSFLLHTPTQAWNGGKMLRCEIGEPLGALRAHICYHPGYVNGISACTWPALQGGHYVWQTFGQISDSICDV